MNGYLALTAHWISSDNGRLALKAALIGFYHVKHRHSGVNIANTILDLLDRANITLKVRLAIFIARRILTCSLDRPLHT